MPKRRTRAWPVVVVALWSGCALGPLASYEPVRPGRRATHAPAAPLALTGREVEALRGTLPAGIPGLADQSAGDEIVVRHVYGEPEYGEYSPEQIAVMVVLAVAILAWTFN